MVDDSSREVSVNVEASTMQHALFDSRSGIVFPLLEVSLFRATYLLLIFCALTKLVGVRAGIL
jgi:hypothetical protein